MKKFKIIKLQAGGYLQSVPPALTLNAMSQQGASSMSSIPGGSKSAFGSFLQNGFGGFGGQGGAGFKDSISGMFKGGKGGSGSGAGFGMIASAANSITDSFMENNKNFQKDMSGKKANITQGLDMVYDKARDTLGQMGPIGLLASGILQTGKMAGNFLDAHGVGTSKMTTTDAILGSSLFNMTGVGLLNNAINKTTTKLDVDQNVVNNSSYTGTGEDITDAGNYADKTYGLLSRKAFKKADKKVLKAKTQQEGIQDILSETKDLRAIQSSSSDMFNNRSQLQQSGVLNNRNIKFGRNGMKFLSTFRKVKQDKENDVNLLPVGALHARNHDINIPGVKTSKGIPVLLEKGGETTQLAEIEKNEIIFRKSITDRLEELYNINTDEAAIEAGRLLVEEILYNTKDEEKFIKSIE